jgi:hypothetical protein
MRTIVGSRILWIGVALLVIGTGPLFVIHQYLVWQGEYPLPPGHPNPFDSNPILWGFGMLGFYTCWPSILLIVIGLGLGTARYLEWID